MFDIFRLILFRVKIFMNYLQANPHLRRCYHTQNNSRIEACSFPYLNSLRNIRNRRTLFYIHHIFYMLLL